MTRIRRIELMLSTAWVMTVSTFQLFVIVVLAAGLIDELGLGRWQIGALGAINTGIGAVAAPELGRRADGLGARRAMIVTTAIGAAGLGLTAVATNYWSLLAASALSGLAQGACNPVTNKVIAEEVPSALQGSVTGVKQSGVQFAVFLSGGLLPLSAVAFGWRVVVGSFALLVAISVVVMGWRFPPLDDQGPADRPDRDGQPVTDRPPAPAGPAPPDDRELDRFVRRIALYAFLLGAAAAGVTRFYPLYAQEVLAFSESEAGLAVAVTGLVAIAARLLWAWITDNLLSNETSLRVLAVGSAVTAGLLLAAEDVASWVLWPAVIVAAFSVVAWNVVAMLTVIRSVPAERSGRSTGVVLTGFLGGLTLSAPLVGYAVDRLGTYRPVWVALALISAAGAFVIGPPSPPRPGRRRSALAGRRRSRR